MLAEALQVRADCIRRHPLGMVQVLAPRDASRQGRDEHGEAALRLRSKKDLIPRCRSLRDASPPLHQPKVQRRSRAVNSPPSRPPRAPRSGVPGSVPPSQASGTGHPRPRLIPARSRRCPTSAGLGGHPRPRLRSPRPRHPAPRGARIATIRGGARRARACCGRRAGRFGLRRAVGAPEGTPPRQPGSRPALSAVEGQPDLGSLAGQLGAGWQST